MEIFIIPVIVAVVASFIFEALRQLFYKRAPILIHEFGNSVTYKIEGSNNYFSTLSIKNKGKKTARNVNASISTKSLDGVEIEVNSNEISNVRTSGDKTHFQFDRLLAQDKIELVFRKVGDRFIPENLMITSDEVLSHEEKESAISSMHYFLTILISILIPMLIVNWGFKLKDKNNESSPVEITYQIDKSITKGMKEIPFSIMITNKSDDLLRDVHYSLRIPGTTFRLYEEHGYIEPGDTLKYKGFLNEDILNQLPVGRHKIDVNVWSESLERKYFAKEMIILRLKKSSIEFQ